MQDSLSVKINADDSDLTRSINNISKMLAGLDSSSDKVTRNMNRRFDRLLSGVIGGAVAGKSLGLSSLLNASQFEKHLTQFFTQAISGIIAGHRAAGGPVSAGRAYIVGENGPETFVPSSSGSIIPSGANRGVTVNMVVNTPDASSFRASKGQISAEMAMAIRRSSRFL